ncbi:TerC/Alx family metal homeostasis membrane protein [Nocardia aurantiaca]|uniref:TerC/Alx family metal homeostasis membrane protein n=1 Tax=Nocardia aurantiaca TaxID=2675850 RepID=A0A6I3L6T1_9NOCA|nr:TerC/Alx family metal homeostasis membrane protein [Nocardia aurantiaca]MTE16215.1 TerC/Alx family metal homeostasis membrane protein [Nocardia aurantiaca]
MSPTLSVLASSTAIDSVGTPWLWGGTMAAVLALLILDFALTRRPHEVSMREAIAWTVFYITLPIAFGIFLWFNDGGAPAMEFFTGYLLEKSLSVDNLFIFMLLLSAFAVPAALAQRVLLYGIAGALVLRGIFIALGAAALATLDWAFLLFGMILLVTAVKLLADAAGGHKQELDVSAMKSVQLMRRVWPVTDDYRGTKMAVREPDPAQPGTVRRALTPLALVVAAVMATDIVFAVDSVPAVYGVTGDPFLVFATNAFALLGLRALYFVLHAALSRLVHLAYGLAAILAFIGVKLVLHWAHGIWSGVPQIPTATSLLVIVLVLVTVTFTSLRATRTREARTEITARTA